MQSNGNIRITLNILNVDRERKTILFVVISFKKNPRLLGQTQRLHFHYLPVCLLCIDIPEDGLSTGRIAGHKCEGNLVD